VFVTLYDVTLAEIFAVAEAPEPPPPENDTVGALE
jgi:hypothetical protein